MKTSRTVVIVSVVAVLLVAGFAGAFALGLYPVPSGDGIGPDDSGNGAIDGGGNGSGTGDDVEDLPFAFTVDDITDCGTTCRVVTATIVNTGNETAMDVTVDVQVFVRDDRIWEGTERIGTLEPDAERTVEKQVKISYRDGLKILDNDGYVTVRTTVTSAEGEWTFSERWKVA